MSENTPVNTIEAKIEQSQNPTKPILENVQEKQEAAPEIKSEENKANWKAFREQREADRKARLDAEKSAKEETAKAEAMKAALEALTNKPYAQSQSFDDVEESEEQRIDKRVSMALQKEREKLEREHREREQKEYPERLQSTYGDFNKVCSAENLDYLEYHYPEVATPYKYLPDGYEKWSAIYKAVKRFVPNVDSRIDQMKVEKNLQKPGSISSPGNTHGGNAMPGARLDDSRKQANWERMQKSLKGLT